MTDSKTEHLVSLCRSLRLSGMANELLDQSMSGNSEELPFLDRLTRLLEAESNLRHNKKVNRIQKKANLRYPAATLDATLHDPERKLDADAIEALAECRWIDDHDNLILTGLTGAGKTYCACALANCAMEKYKTVRYEKAERLILDLKKYESHGTLLDRLEELAEYDLLIIDDFGFMSLDRDQCHCLFQLLDMREGNKSTCLVSQVFAESWWDLFRDQAYGEGCIARLLHNSYTLRFQGKDCRNQGKDLSTLKAAQTKNE